MTQKELLERLEVIYEDSCTTQGQYDTWEYLKELIADLKKPVVYEVEVGSTDLDIIYRIGAYKIERLSKPRTIETDIRCLYRLNITLMSLGLDPITIDNLKIIEK